MKKLLVISTSLRRNSNSATLAQRFADGARSAGNDVEVVELAGKELGFCRGCLTCQTTKRCVMHDDADAIERKMGEADVIAFATPVYYYGMSGQMKTVLDRANPLYVKDYRFRDVYLLSSAAEDSDHAFRRTIDGLEGWIACFANARLAGSVCAGGVTNSGAIAGHPALARAFELGAAI